MVWSGPCFVHGPFPLQSQQYTLPNVSFQLGLVSSRGTLGKLALVGATIPTKIGTALSNAQTSAATEGERHNKQPRCDAAKLDAGGACGAWDIEVTRTCNVQAAQKTIEGCHRIPASYRLPGPRWDGDGMEEDSESTKPKGKLRVVYCPANS